MPQTETSSNKLITPASTDGVEIGQSATDLVGFYGKTPVVQPTNAAQAAVVDTSGGAANPATGITTITGTYNGPILANAVATLAAQGNALRTALVNLGLIKGS